MHKEISTFIKQSAFFLRLITLGIIYPEAVSVVHTRWTHNCNLWEASCMTVSNFPERLMVPVIIGLVFMTMYETTYRYYKDVADQNL